MAAPPLPRPLLVAYDGSAPSKYALERAAQLWPGASVLVGTVWSSARGLGPAGLAALPESVVHEAVRKLDAVAERAGGALAEEGARLATEHGLQATPVTRREDGNVWATLDNLAEEHDVTAVVVGSRGRSELHAFLLGSVTHGLVHHSRRPVVVVRDAREG